MMLPTKDQDKRNLIAATKTLKAAGFTPVGYWLFEKNGVTYDLSAADLSQIERIEREKLFVVCPFCRARQSGFGKQHFRCGTRFDADTNSYKTGTECDKDVFREGFLASIEILKRLVSKVDKSVNYSFKPGLKKIMKEAKKVIRKYGE